MTSRAQLSRVTLVGERRRADIVLPSDTPIGQLLPDILQLLDDRAASRPMTRQLITSDGSALPHDSTLSSAEIADGAVLRLVRAHSAPPAPVVHDVTDLVADDLDLQAWRWRPAARRASAGVATVAFAVIAALLARREFALDALAGALVAVTLLLLVAGALVARIGQGNRGLATALLLASGGLGILTAWTAADAYDWSGTVRLAAVAGALVLDCCCSATSRRSAAADSSGRWRPPRSPWCGRPSPPSRATCPGWAPSWPSSPWYCSGCCPGSP